jgi:nucleotide-binding universal stress UspA family protein
MNRRRIVIALDLSEYSQIVLEHGLDQAVRAESTDLHFLSVVSEDIQVEATKLALAKLVLPALEDVSAYMDWRMHLHVRVGPAAKEIAALADDVRAHLIVIGRFGTHHPRRRLGSVASKVIDLAPCPTLVVGLTTFSAEADAQCPACVEVRAESAAEQWFCGEHQAPDRQRLTALVTPNLIRTGGGGGPMW